MTICHVVKLRHFWRPKFDTLEIWIYTSCETLGSNFKNLRKMPLGKPTRILKTLTTCQIIITRRFFYTAQFFNFLGFFYYFSDLSILLSCVTCGNFFQLSGSFLWSLVTIHPVVKFLAKLRHFRLPKFDTHEIWSHTSCKTLESNFKNFKKYP